MSLRKWSIRLAAIVLAVLSAVALTPSVIGAQSDVARHPGKFGTRYVIRGHLVPALRGLAPTRATAGERALQLSIALNLRDPDGLDALLAAQNNPASPLYHVYITPQQFTQRFAPTQASVDAVTQYLRSQGLRITSVAPNRLLVDATGSVSSVEHAFSVQIADYTVRGHSVYAPINEPSVPTALAGTILSIGGLDDAASYHHLDAARPNAPSAQAPHNGSGPGGGFTPSELRTAYDMNSLISGDNGSGQTVAIFELDGYKSSDVNQYLSYYGLGSAKYSNVLVDGATGSAGSGAIEVELDMEVVSAIAPGATQKIYIGPNSTSGVNDTYNKIVTDNIAKVTSTSWGECEANSGTSELAALDNIFKQGAAQGQSFFAAAGDSGAYDCDTTALAVDSPADDPNVVGVGGTNLQTGSGGTYSSESVWNCSTCSGRGPEGTGGGGGLSTYFSKPSYQTGPGTTNAYSNGMRQVPDVSADADPNSGYSFYCTVTAAGCSSSGWGEVGGTSAAAPLWAGVAADTNQYLAGQGKATLGNANATLYHLFNTTQTYTAYHDITSGNNLYYPATSGYDEASGIGTPDVWNLARDAAGSSSGGGGGGGTTSQLLSNPGFESGQSPWQESSSGGYQIVDPTNPHTGSYSAYLCGYNSCNDQIWQTVTLPSTTTKVVLSYWLYIDTNEASGSPCYDNFYARVRNGSGTTITTVQTKCNANANNAWVQYSFDISSALSGYAGKQVQVYFQGTTDSSLPTDFFVDDVALNVTH